MPNHCSNDLVITGNSKLLNKLMKQVEITPSEETNEHSATKFSCHKVIPRPSSQDSNWYDWNINNWGSKWDCYDIGDENTENYEKGLIHYYFSTAWSPISKVIAELARQYPKLDFEYNYYEGGSDFWGKEFYSKGKLKSFEDGELSTASCEIKEFFEGSEHHTCRICENLYECNGNLELCDDCLEEELNKEEELSKETESKTNDTFTKV